jgi:hypothetical protein
MKKLLYLGIIIPVVLAGCFGASSRYDGGKLTETGAVPPQPAPEEMAQEDPVQPETKEEEKNYFYFSYDDSASTASVELVKYRIGLGVIPYESYGRPWEFLNYEDFGRPEHLKEGGPFSAALGLWKRQNGENPEYLLGASVSSPYITRNTPAVITLVVDVSGSMDEASAEASESMVTRMEAVVHGLNQMVSESLIPGDVINLVTFSTEAETVFTGKRYPEDKDFMSKVISRLAPENSTNLNAGIEKGYAAAWKHYDQDKNNRVIILTDAWANQGEVDPGIISKYTRINNMEGIYFSGIGIGSGFNEAFLNELTEEGKGAYFLALSKTDAAGILTEKFPALIQVAARDVRFKLEYPGSLTHKKSAGEEVSVVAEEVQPTNFSFNTTQFFLEKFSGSSNTELKVEDTFVLTVTYKDPVTFKKKEEVFTWNAADILGKMTGKIRDAEAVVLLAEMVANKTTPAEADKIYTSYYTGYSSPIFDEYYKLITKLAELKSGEDTGEDRS